MARRWKALFEPPAISDQVVNGLLKVLYESDVAYLRAHPNTPPVYRSGVRYARERFERWRSIPVILEGDGTCDCEDLASWRAAELTVAGMPSVPFFVKQRASNGAMLYHIKVRRGDGVIEDPSRGLGMRG